jgi:Tfp pilus assembly protein PilP
MTSRMKLLLIAVGMLVLVNLWRWWPQVDPASPGVSQSRETPASALELRLAGYDPESSGGEVSIRRDLFFPQQQESTAEKKATPPATQNPQQARSVSRDDQVLQELRQYRLVGVLSRKGNLQGFLVRDGKNFSVRRGDRLENRYSVDELTTTSITLSHPDSRVSHRIELE